MVLKLLIIDLKLNFIVAYLFHTQSNNHSIITHTAFFWEQNYTYYFVKYKHIFRGEQLNSNYCYKIQYKHTIFSQKYKI